MRTAALSFLLLSAAAPAAWGQAGEGKSLEAVKPIDGELIKKPSDPAALKKMFALCKKTGDCKKYLLEKEKEKKLKDNPESRSVPEVAPAVPVPVPLPGEPRGAFVPGADVPAGGPGAAAPTADQAEVMGRDAGARRERTMSRASGAADAMRRSFFPAEDAAPRKPGGPERGEAAPPAEKQGVPELALAARSGYAVTLRDQGLKVGAGPRGEPAIQRADGSPASEADLERLRTALRAEPAALARRPDFFAVLPREKFADLKRDFAGKPELRSTVFKDIGMTAGARDFQWSASCSVLSGACNPNAGAGAYRKGQDVPPEDLDSIWSAAQEEILEDDEEFGEYTDEDRRLAAEEDLAAEKLAAGRRSGPSLASLLSRLGALPRSLVAAAGSAADDVPAPVAGEGAPSAAASVANVAAAGAVPPASPRPSGPPPAPGGRDAEAGRSGVYVLAAAAAAVLLLLAARKKA